MYNAALFLRTYPVECGIFDAGFSPLYSDNSPQRLVDSVPCSMILYKLANSIRLSENLYGLLKWGRDPFLIQSPIFEARDLEITIEEQGITPDERCLPLPPPSGISGILAE
jgi:hypothetical protein